MRTDLRDKKEKIRAVAVRLAEQMKHHISMYEERHRAMESELKQMGESLDKRQRAAEAEQTRGLEEMDRDVREGFVKVSECMDALEVELEDKNRLFQEKLREAITSVNDVLGKEGRAWRNQIREISLINEMHQHIILESFQNSNAHIDNLEKCLADLSEELSVNFGTVQAKMVEIRAEFNTASLISKIQTNLRFTGVTDSLDKLRKVRARDLKQIVQRIDRERTDAMQLINPVRMRVNKLGTDLGECQERIASLGERLETGTGGLRREMETVLGEMNRARDRNEQLEKEVRVHLEDQERLMREYQEEIGQNKEEVLKQFDQKCSELEEIEQKRVEETKRLIIEESLRIRENLQAQNHSVWERLVASESAEQEDFMMSLMKQNQANFFSFLVGPEDIYKVPRNDLEGTKKEWLTKDRFNGNIDEQRKEPSPRSSPQNSRESNLTNNDASDSIN